MTAKLEALRALLDEAILDSRRRLDDSTSLDRSYSSNAGKTKSYSSVFNTENVLNYNDNSNNDNSLLHDEEAIYWKKRCMAMTDTQKNGNRDPLLSNVENELKQAQEREDHAALLVKSLEDKISELESSGKASHNNNNTATSDSNTNTHHETLRRELLTKMESRRKLLSFMEWLTSTSIKKKAGDGHSNGNSHSNDDEKEEYICTIKNRVDKRASRFSVIPILDEDELLTRRNSLGPTGATGEGEDGVEGPPIQFIPRANVEYLPDYLRESSVEVERDMVPVLMSDILKSMFQDDDDEEEEEAGDA